jgi:SNF2 family DNA or RNA helicase
VITIEKHTDTKVIVTSDYPMRDREQLKALPGSSYDLRRHIWTAPLTWATCVAMRGMFGDDLVIGASLTEWATRERAERIDPAVQMRQAWDDESIPFPDLYPFQRAGVSFMTFAKQALLCDEMGTGKTVQTIRTLANIVRNGGNPFPAVVVAPNNMTLTWKKEFEFWYPGVKVGVVKGGIAQRRAILADKSLHVYVINYEGVRSHSKLASYGSIALRKCHICDPMMPDDKDHTAARCQVHPKELNKIDFKTLIVDEAHRMKDPKSQQSRAVRALRTATTEWVYPLTGTAIADSPVDLWSSLNLIAPLEFPSRSKYIERYCLQSYNMFGGMSVTGLNPLTKDEFFSVVDPRMRRMPKEAVLPFLPPKIPIRRYVEMTAKQAKAYKQMDDNQIAILGDLQDGVTVAANPLTELTRLTQFSSAFAELDDEGGVRLSEPSNKIDALMEILEDTGEEPLVVMAQSRQLIELAATRLRKAGVSISMIVGGQTVDEREDAKDDFQNGKVRVVLCTIAAGGIGITLTRANRIVFLQRSWSMIENKQAEDRVHRIGSEKFERVEIIDIISVNTVEEAQHVALAGKEERLQEIMRDADTVARVRGEGNDTE